MAKRKAGVNDIIFELDNDDIVISSDEDSKESKIGRFGGENSKKIKGKKINKEEIHSDIINIDNACEPPCNVTSPDKTQNGGKYIPKVTSIQNNANVQTNCKTSEKDVVIDINDEKIDCQDTILFHEDIAVDSPTSNTDLGVVGCENKAPLVSVRFKDSFLAHNYKKRIKEFIVTLLKTQNNISADSETDNELEIWPEDLVEVEFDKFEENAVEDNLFFVDTAPCDESHSDIPTYSQAKNILSNVVEKEVIPQTLRRGPVCFNCEGPHQLKDCSLPRDNVKINERRKAVTPKVGRYHVEDDQKYGHLVPGRISGDLRHALGLKRYELPLHVYRMRLLGYPPGWLEEARISHSGITLFDSSGTATLDPDEEEGEVCEPGSKDKFDIKKILDFPGFNVSASSRYIEEAELFGLPPMSDQDSKMAMLQILAPNAMKAYKRKKLSFFPSASKNHTHEGQAEMELDSGDEVAEFPLIPPLPDDEPPPPPPPPPPPVEAEPSTQQKSHIKKNKSSKSPELKTSDNKEKSSNQFITDGLNRKLENDSTNKEATESSKQKDPEPIQETVDIDLDGSSDDLEIIEVVRVNDIPMPEEDLIIIDDDDKSSVSSDCYSPTLHDLEERKQRLLDALKGDNVSVTSFSIENMQRDKVIDKNSGANKTIEIVPQLIEVSNEENAIKEVSIKENAVKGNDVEKDQSIIEPEKPTTASNEATSTSEPQMDNKAGKVRDTLYGTPVWNVASPYSKLPSDEKFAKDICDVINFENLPNSIGKFKQISNMLKKVKTEVDRIHDS